MPVLEIDTRLPVYSCLSLSLSPFGCVCGVGERADDEGIQLALPSVVVVVCVILTHTRGRKGIGKFALLLSEDFGGSVRFSPSSA